MARQYRKRKTSVNYPSTAATSDTPCYSNMLVPRGDAERTPEQQQTDCRVFLADCGFEVVMDTETKEFKTRGDLTAVRKLIAALKNGTAPKQHLNRQHVLDYMDSHGRTGIPFKTFSDYLENGSIPLAQFQAARDRMEKAIGDKLAYAVTNARLKKRRALSDCDGEYNPDRRLSLMPYENIVKRPTPEKTLAINAHYAVSAHVDSDSLQSYAATIWAIVGIAEANSVMCDVVRTNRTTNACESSDKLGWAASEAIRIKKTGEYIAPSMLAIALHPATYRCAAWIARAFAMSSFGVIMNSGVGSAWQPPHVLLSEPGSLELSSRVVQELPEHLEQVIVEKITGGQANHAA